MITQDERDKLNQWYADYSANNAKPMDYVTWLEYMLTHRSSLLEQNAEYAEYLKAALDGIQKALSAMGASREKPDMWDAIVKIAIIVDKIKSEAE